MNNSIQLWSCYHRYMTNSLINKYYSCHCMISDEHQDITNNLLLFFHIFKFTTKLWLLDSPHKEPIMLEAFPSHNINMNFLTPWVFKSFTSHLRLPFCPNLSTVKFLARKCLAMKEVCWHQSPSWHRHPPLIQVWDSAVGMKIFDKIQIYMLNSTKAMIWIIPQT